MRNTLTLILAALAAAPFAHAGDQDCKVTEYTHKGLFGEFIEVTNTGLTAVDVNGWKYDDNTRSFAAGTLLFSAATVLSPDDCFIITEVSEAVFIQAWYVDSGEGVPAGLVAIHENNFNNLGNVDEINIYEDSGILIDRVTLASIGLDTEGVSAILTNTGWKLAVAGVGNSWKAGAPLAPGPVGSPGVYPNE